jgi:hypothetical protein
MTSNADKIGASKKDEASLDRTFLLIEVAKLVEPSNNQHNSTTVVLYLTGSVHPSHVPWATG